MVCGMSGLLRLPWHYGQGAFGDVQERVPGKGLRGDRFGHEEAGVPQRLGPGLGRKP